MQFINLDVLKEGLSNSADSAELSDAELEMVSGRGGNPGASCDTTCSDDDWTWVRDPRGAWVSTSACDVWWRDSLTWDRW